MMEFISLYDNALIYYPNIFFPTLFFLSILGIIFLSIEIIVISKKVRRFTEEIKRNLYNKKKKASFVSITRFFLKRKKIFFVYIIFFIYITKVFFIRMNTQLVRFELQIEKIVKKIGKEILIEE
ncbi:MAG: hypothetical protein Q7K54_00475 [Candidatus Parcubacteria bacterium]|nr:hypothetical protein [Candidatus Parcubacteria bacterium]